MKSAQDYKKVFSYITSFIQKETLTHENIAVTMNAESSYFMRFNNAKSASWEQWSKLLPP